MASRAGKVLGSVLGHGARAVWVSLMILTPLFGFWLASSLAAFHNATQWLSLLVGLLLFPLLPVGWDLLFLWRRKKREVTKPAILTRLDRLVLRTLLINGLFLGVMMWQARATSFRALAVRGDWMLEGFDGPIASTVRDALLGFADLLDKRTTKPVDSGYGHSDKAPDDVKPPPPPPPLPPTPPPTTDTPPPPKDPLAYPLAPDFHPLVVNMPDSEQTSVEAVGAYMAARITNKRELVKALHDYVVNRLHYDRDALKLIEAGDFEHTPPQTAEAVFASRTAVCEGYSRLMVALGKAAGIEIAYITGNIRDAERRLAITAEEESTNKVLEGIGHAWNAVKLDDGWHLIDATWDDPTNGDHTTTYLFVPPRMMAYDHFPEDPTWQLLPEPLSLGDFVRQPLLSPAIAALGLELTSPTRSQITVSGEATLELANPANAAVAGRVVREGSGQDVEGEPCESRTTGTKSTLTCKMSDGEYEIRMYAAPHAATLAGSYRLDYIGSILVNSH